MRAFFLFLGLIPILVSCGGKSPAKTNFQFEIANQNLSVSVTGGIVIFGKSSNGDKFSRVANDTGSIQEELSQGTWTFGIVAWSGTTPFTGTINCGTQTVSISGASATVNITLSNASCFQSTVTSEVGTGTIPNKAFAAVTPSFCENDVSGYTGTLCSYTPSSPAANQKGFVGSYRFSIEGSRQVSGAVSTIAGEALISPCYNAETNNDVAPPNANVSTLNIPFFYSSLGFPLKLQAFLGPACGTANINGRISLSVNDPLQTKFSVTSPSTKLLFARTPISTICSVSDVQGNSTFASGRGSASVPYVICSLAQLKYLQQNMGNATVQASSFILGRNLDLLPWVSGKTTSAPYHTCLEEGDTFIPLGLDFDNAVSCNVIPLGTPTGTFDGNGNTIKFFRFRNKGSLPTGFFSTTTGSIMNLKFDNASVEGQDYTGVAVGQFNGSAMVNVTVSRSNSRGDDKTGGIAGSLTAATLIGKLFADKMDIEGDSYTGGLIGYATSSSSMSELSFSGKIYAESGSSYVGGIVGSFNNSVNNAVSTGEIRAQATYIAGILGEDRIGYIHSFLRSDMLIQDYDSNPSSARYFAGLVANPFDVTRSMYHGFISTPCVSGGCLVGSISSTSLSSNLANVASFGFGATLGGTDAGSIQPISALTTGSTIATALCSSFGAGCPWTQASGDLPRLSFESHPCTDASNAAAVSAQISAGRGSSANPISICTVTQFTAMPSYPGKAFLLRRNLNLSQVSGSQGTFSGSFDGNHQLLFAFDQQETGTNMALYSLIASGSVFKNTSISAFVTSDTTTCANCLKSTLALQNSGTLSGIRVQGGRINLSDTTAMAGGLVASNLGTISDVIIRDLDLRGFFLGGISYSNSGSILSAISDARFQGLSGGTYTYGGISGTSSGTIKKSIFEGNMTSFHNTDVNTGTGGIVGILQSPGLIEDSFVSPEASLEPSTSGSNLGGLAGKSDAATNKIVRSLMKGFISDTVGEATYQPLVGTGSGSFINSNSHYLSSTYKYIDSPVSSSSGYASPNCVVSIITSADPSLTLGYGAIQSGQDFYTGTLVKNTANDFTFTFEDYDNDCGSISVSSLYEAWSAPETVTLAGLRLQGYDITDIRIGTEKDRLLSAYMSYLSTGVATNPPVWIFDDEDRGLGLFGIHD